MPNDLTIQDKWWNEKMASDDGEVIVKAFTFNNTDLLGKGSRNFALNANG